MVGVADTFLIMSLLTSNNRAYLQLKLELLHPALTVIICHRQRATDETRAQTTHALHDAWERSSIKPCG